MRRSILIASLAALLLAAVPTAASAQNKLFQDFRKNGSINPCNYTNKQLQQGLNGLPPDVQQYAPGFGDQLRGGRGNCGGGGGSGSSQQGNQQNDGTGGGAAPGGGGGNGGGGAGAPRPALKVAAPPAPSVGRSAPTLATPNIDAAPSGANAPGWLVFLLVLAAAGGVLAFVARRRGWSAAEHLRPLRAAFSEAGGRFADSAATTRDRLRPRRS